jgi:glycosyltransferase involved in cell wall biosynthesis/predicted metal-dependent phosphoesterase TrpH
MTLTRAARSDLHCHSHASRQPRLGVQRALGLPECATPPEEVYRLAKRRGMDFVTITDHDTIDGVLELGDRPDVFLSVELTAGFPRAPQAVHVLCWDISPDDHEWLQARRGDVEDCAAYLHEHEIACALAHPFYAVAAPLTSPQRRRLAELFPVWETRNGSRARELNLPAAVYIETHGGTGVGGSDDHAGIDVGRTFTETPPARTPAEMLRHVRDGRAEARGDQGSAAKWAHSAIALAARVHDPTRAAPPIPGAVLRMVERVVSEGSSREGPLGTDLGPDDARALLRAWLEAMDLNVDGDELIAYMQSNGFSHADLFRRARRVHERKLQQAAEGARLAVEGGDGAAGAALRLFEACVAAVPYAPAAAFLGKEKAKLARRDAEPPRVALVADAVGDMHGVTNTLDQIREHGVPGFDVEVVGTDRNVDRRLPAVAEVDIPFYPGLQVGVPSLPVIVELLAEGRYDLIHLCSPGPAGMAAALVAQGMELPCVGSYHTELAAYAGVRSGDDALARAVASSLRAFYASCAVVLSPSRAADRSLRALGVDWKRIGRWERGVDLSRFDPLRRDPGAFGPGIAVLYVGRLTAEKGVDLLADAFLAAYARDPRLHLVLAGGGPEEERLRARLGVHATFLGWLAGDELARAYASADIFLFASRTDTYGQVIVEAQASGLPVVAVAEGGPCELVSDGRTGRLCPATPDAVADAVVELASDPARRARLARAGHTMASGRTWTRALGQLAAGYARCLAPATGVQTRRAA